MAITIRPWRLERFGSIAGACGALLAALATPARATDWSVVPAVRLRESYSDNALLAPQALAKDDFISEIAPSIMLHGAGTRLRLDLAYTLQKLIYLRQSDVTSHQLQASGNAELLEDWLFIDARSSIGRRNVSAFGPQAIDDLQQTDNQRTVRTHTLSPYLRHHFHGLATTDLRYEHNIVNSGGDLLAVKTDAVILDITGDTGPQGWGWGAHYDRRESKDNRLTPVRTSKGSLSLRYQLSSKLNLFGDAGYERQGYAALNAQAPQGRHWSLGGGWYPSSRSSVVLSTGKRFFGQTYALDVTHQARNSTWKLNYGEDITSTPTQLSRLNSSATASLLDNLWAGMVPNPQLRRQRIDAFLRLQQLLGPEVGAVNSFSHSYYLQKQLGMSMASVSSKSTLALGVTATQRTAQSNSGIDSALLPDVELAFEERTRQLGADAGWSWRMTPRNNLNLGASFGTVKSLSLGRRDGNLVLKLGLSRTLQPKVTGAIDLRHVRHTSTRGGDYRENAIGASLSFQL